jgi:putative addiction module killer protein
MRCQDRAARTAIIARINKVRRGILGDYDDVGDGILELRFIGPGPGYRIYCADDGRKMVLLLCGGVKRTQEADICYAKVLWSEYNDAKKATKKGAQQHRSVRGSIKE